MHHGPNYLLNKIRLVIFSLVVNKNFSSCCCWIVTKNDGMAHQSASSHSHFASTGRSSPSSWTVFESKGTESRFLQSTTRWTVSNSTNNPNCQRCRAHSPHSALQFQKDAAQLVAKEEYSSRTEQCTPGHLHPTSLLGRKNFRPTSHQQTRQLFL